MTNLDTRVVRILRWLLDQNTTRSTEALAQDLGLSQRVVRYRLGAVESHLRTRGLELHRQRGAGLWIEGANEAISELRQELSEVSEAPKVYARDERDHVLIADLLWTAPEATSLDQLHEILEVSKASARRDLRRNEEWLERRGLVVVRRPGVGVGVAGPEIRIRQALVQLTVEAVPHEVLAELCVRSFDEAKLVHVRVPAGLREHLKGLPLQRTANLITGSSFQGLLEQANNELVFCLYLAVTAARLADGKTIIMDTGQHRSLADHPVSATAESIASQFAAAFGLDLPELEIAGITEYLLGLTTLGLAAGTDHEDRADLLDQLMAIAAERLHPTLGGDAELRRSLSQHIERLGVRLRYRLPVHNPLLAEVAERYPDVHAVAHELGSLISEHFSAPMPADEVGFVTMYLSGAMERSRLKPSRRAVVVCPSGMATVWVLVSRLQAEFPQIELVSVQSTGSYEEMSDSEVDLVISTVEIEEGSLPVIVVSPLLTASDIKRLATFT